MAYEGILINIPTLVAGEDLSDNQYYFVKFDGDGDVVGLDGADDGGTSLAIGVLQNDPDTEGASATVACAGISKVIAGENGLEAGDYITSDDDGKAVEVGATEYAYGIVIDGGDEDEVISVLLGYVPAQLNA